ncbi:hypothetical protein Mal4_02320 [Maioricimonas rarisocia]|uniref:Uncharacterized protein n=1 Tax=Maioricimonas rarisocia TaxID=2528026 RepID=A0A517Z0D6_9PLAN|nr:hypothetical protein [Maioricimonas rarisocia]QDU35950.1 hypothetical protein Mal4_02320 [Maioricimonas rarisocia]
MPRRSFSPDASLLLVIAAVVAIGTVMQRPELRLQAIETVRSASHKLARFAEPAPPVTSPSDADDFAPNAEPLSGAEVPTPAATVGSQRVRVIPPPVRLRTVSNRIVRPTTGTSGAGFVSVPAGGGTCH